MPRLWARADAVREVDVAAVLPVVQPAVVEGVEHELAREPEQVERARAVVRDERSGRGEVLARHDLGRLVGAVVVGGVLGGEAGERGVEIAQLLVGVTGLAQLVATSSVSGSGCGRGAPDRRGCAARWASP